MFYKIIRYISKYNLMFLIYILTSGLSFKLFGTSYITLVLTTLIINIYFELLKKCSNLTNKK